MKRNTLIAFAALGCLMAGSLASQSVEARGLNKIQRRQERQIRRGVKHGSLTAKEAQELWDEQADIRDAKRDARENGKVTKGERQNIRDMQREARHNILLQKNDGQVNENAQKYKD